MKKWLCCAIFILGLWHHPAEAQAPIKLARERIVLHTSLGDIVLALYFELAPAHAQQIAQLSYTGTYDSTWVNYIEPGQFFAFSPPQDRYKPLSPAQQSHIKPLPLLPSALLNERGTVSIVSQNTNPHNPQHSLIIVTGRATTLDGKATIIGHVERGHEVMDRIEKIPTDKQGVPLQDIQIIKTEVINFSDQLKFAHDEYTLSTAEYLSVLNTDPWLNFFGGIFLLGILTFVLGRKIGAYWLAPMGLLIALVAGYGLFIWINPRAGGIKQLSYVGFFGMLALYRLMGFFEQPRKRQT